MTLRGEVRSISLLLGLCGCLTGAADPPWRSAVAEARQLQQQGGYAAAEGVLQAALAVAEREPGADGRIPILLNNLASVCQDRGEIDEAERYYRRSIAWIERANGKGDAALAKPLHNLASLYSEHGEYRTAERLERRALALSGLPDAEVPQLLHGLAMALDGERRYAEAESLYRRVLDIWRTTEGHQRDLADLLTNLGDLYGRQKRPQEGIVHLRQAISILESSVGISHPALVKPLLNLAAIHIEVHQPSVAEPLVSRAVTIAEAAYGTENEVYGAALSTLALVLRHLSRQREAKEVERRARTILAASRTLASRWQTVDVSELGQQARPRSR